MKKIQYTLFGLLLALIVGCTSEFEKYKSDNDNLTREDVSAKYFFTNTITGLYFPPTWDYNFARNFHAPVFGAYSSFGNKKCWENPDVIFDSSGGWANDPRVWGAYADYYLKLDVFLKLVQKGGEFENPLMEAVAIIIRSSYFAMHTDIYGELPYSEVGKEGILTPKFDTQKEIYEGIIADLNASMETIGNNPTTGDGVFDLGEYDIIFGGDLQKWKAYANALKLRQALRAKGAPGADFADAAITEALQGPLPTEDVKIVKDLSSGVGYEGYTTLYDLSAARMLSDHLINTLQDNDDPRLPAFAEKIPGGEITFKDYTNVNNKVLIDYLLTTLDDASVVYSKNETGNDLIITIVKNKFYAGQPLRFKQTMKTFLDYRLFSRYNLNIEGGYILGTENDHQVMPLAEVKLMQAEAALLGFGGDANAFFKEGIASSFAQWKVADNGYIASSMGTLSGTNEEKLQQIGLQYWLATNQVDFQGFAYARDFKLEGITDDIPNDPVIFSTQISLGLGFPQRMKYGAASYSLNGDNTEEAVARQGVDDITTQLWFAKGSKL